MAFQVYRKNEYVESFRSEVDAEVYVFMMNLNTSSRDYYIAYRVNAR